LFVFFSKKEKKKKSSVLAIFLKYFTDTRRLIQYTEHVKAKIIPFSRKKSFSAIKIAEKRE